MMMLKQWTVNLIRASWCFVLKNQIKYVTDQIWNHKKKKVGSLQNCFDDEIFAPTETSFEYKSIDRNDYKNILIDINPV